MRLFAWVIRCRQSNVHGTLIPDDVVQTAQDILNTLEESELTDDHDLKFDLTTEEGQALLAKIMLSLRVSEGDDSQEYSDCTCDVCFEDLDEESVRILQHCRHIFCCNCLDTIKSKGSSKCPVCRQTFGKKDIISKAVAEEAAKNAAAEEDKKSKNKSEPSKSAGKHQMHPKEVAVLDELSNMDPDCKAVIFSEWTSVLDIIQGTIERHGYVTTRIDGSMDTDERVAAIENFESDHPGSPRVILCSTVSSLLCINYVASYSIGS